MADVKLWPYIFAIISGALFAEVVMRVFHLFGR